MGCEFIERAVLSVESLNPPNHITRLTLNQEGCKAIFFSFFFK